MHSVLFVCTANICRSPMAMGLLRAKTAHSKEAWRIESAGTWALQSRPAAEKTRQVLEQQGIDVSDHHSRPVTRELLDSFNLILTMERGHKEALQVEFPRLAGRVYTLTEMVDGFGDIEDPIGGSPEAFEATYEEIDQILEQGFDKIKQLSES
jgi:protein-tyrosine-phosphatase